MASTAVPPPVVGARLDLLRSLGFDALQHDSHVPFLSHLIGTRRVLAEWGACPALCDAGLFHSVYGTEYFEPDKRADRAAVVSIIGAEAERIAWLWCSIERATLDPGAATVRLRSGAEPIGEATSENGGVVRRSRTGPARNGSTSPRSSLDGAIEPLTRAEVADVATLWAADTVEQVARMAPDERAFADGLLAVLDSASAPTQVAVRDLQSLLD